MYCHGMPLLSPAASRECIHALKHKMYQKRKDKRGSESEKKSHKIYRDGEVMRGEREQRQIYITLRVFLKDTLTETCACWRTHIGPVTSWLHDGKTQATPPSLLAFALPRIFHCWQESTMRSVECQYDIVPTLIWQQTQHGVLIGYDNWCSHVWPAEWTIVVTTLHTNEKIQALRLLRALGNCSETLLLRKAATRSSDWCDGPTAERVKDNQGQKVVDTNCRPAAKKHSGEVKEKHYLLHQHLLSTRLTSDPSGLIDGANEA